MKKICRKIVSVLLCAALLAGGICLVPAQAYEQTYPLPALTGNQAIDIVAVAKSQVGYTEDGAGGTAYGAWMSQNSLLLGQYYDFTYVDWCSSFVCWSAEHAGIPRGIVFSTLSASVDIMFSALQLSGATVTYDYSNYTPKCGDLVFYSYGGQGYDHVAITDGNNHYIHANYASAVTEVEGNLVHRLADGYDYPPSCYVSPNYRGSAAEANDREAPVITEYGAVNVTPDGFDMVVMASDNVGIARATFAVWSLENGQDDITLEAGIVNGNTISYAVKAADHNDEYGEYYIECTVYDPLGNNTSLSEFLAVIPPDDSEPPVIKNVKITEKDHTGFTVTADVTDNIRVYKTQVTAWTEENGTDDVVWHTGEVKDGKVTIRVPSAEHGDSYGNYLAQLYVYDLADNMTLHDNIKVRVPTPDSTPPAVSNVRISDPTGVGFRLTASVSDESGIARATVDVVTKTKDNEVSMQFPAEINGEALSCVTDNGNHLGEQVEYTVVLSVYDANENMATYKTDYNPGVVNLTTADTDGDGEISESDARLILLASAELEQLSSAQTVVGDMDGDGIITAADAREIHRVALGKSTLEAE
ncbi:MAG: GBS Bsp-like repeat-containing protein [Clostridia bacterium]|nr:GBS Bsp-like repeat-containing protein [Clostridia bacterium]